MLIPGAGSHVIGAHAPAGSLRQSAVDVAEKWVGKNGKGLSALFVPAATYTNVAGMLGADKPATGQRQLPPNASSSSRLW